MGRKRTPSLYKRRDCWHIDKKVFGERLYESTGISDLEEAEKYLARRIEMLRQAVVYGVRPQRTFSVAAAKYLLENQHKRSIRSDISRLKMLDRCIGDMSLDQIHMGTLQLFIDERRKSGVKMRTINHGLKVVRRILNLAANEWIDGHGLTWLLKAPKIKFLLGHRSSRITTHYSAAELSNLIAAANKVCNKDRMPKLILLKSDSSLKSPVRDLREAS